jgi:hypothetical protein
MTLNDNGYSRFWTMNKHLEILILTKATILITYHKLFLWIQSNTKNWCLMSWTCSTITVININNLYNKITEKQNMYITARTARFSKKSPWSVFFHGEMSVICHKITVKCRWNHGETFTAKINKLGPKCRWNILIAGDNTAAKIIRVYTYM